MSLNIVDQTSLSQYLGVCVCVFEFFKLVLKNLMPLRKYSVCFHFRSPFKNVINETQFISTATKLHKFLSFDLIISKVGTLCNFVFATKECRIFKTLSHKIFKCGSLFFVDLGRCVCVCMFMLDFSHFPFEEGGENVSKCYWILEEMLLMIICEWSENIKCADKKLWWVLTVRNEEKNHSHIHDVKDCGHRECIKNELILRVLKNIKNILNKLFT